MDKILACEPQTYFWSSLIALQKILLFFRGREESTKNTPAVHRLTKPLHQNILSHIAFFFTLFKGYRYNYTKGNFLFEPAKIDFKFRRSWENTGNIIICKTSFCEMWISLWSLFSRAPMRTFSLKLFHITYYIYSPRKV